MSKPGMTRMNDGESLRKPCAAPLIEVWMHSHKVRFIFRASALCFIQQLNFWCDIGNAFAVAMTNACERECDAWIASAEPLLIVSIGNHKLDFPGSRLVRAAPYILNAGPERLIGFPFAKRPGAHRRCWMCLL